VSYDTLRHAGASGGAMVGSVKQIERQFVETGAEPEFFVNHTRIEVAAGGNVRIFCYSERHKGEFHLLYIAVVPAKELAEMSRRSLAASSDARNLEQWGDDETKQ
jgi:hypothetical protein